MKLQKVKSSMIVAVGYDPRKHLLEVVFKTGDHYCYENVPPDEYDGLIKAESKGKYMQSHIIEDYSGYRVRR